MARPDRRGPGNGEPRANTLAEGNPVPNVLRGIGQPGSAGRAGAPAGREAATGGRPWRRATPSEEIRGRREVAGRTERPTSEQPTGRRASIPGCGCSGWAVLLGLLFLAIRLVGACNEAAAPATTIPPASPPPARTAVYWQDLEPGHCFVWPEDAQAISEVTLVACSVAHDVEVTGSVELVDAPGSAYDEDAVARAARLRCDDVHAAYTGQRAPASGGSAPEVIYPGAEAWKGGDRTVICLAEGDAPGALTGSVRATAAP